MKKLINLLDKYDIEWSFYRNDHRSLYYGQNFRIWDHIVINRMFELVNYPSGWELKNYEVQNYIDKNSPTCIMLQAFVLGLMKNR